VGVYKKAQNVR